MRVFYNKFLICFILFSQCGFNPLYAGFRSALDSIKLISIRSNKQKVINKDHIFLEGDVEVLLDYKIHILADSIELDKEKQILVANAKDDGFVKLENPDFVMLAEHIELNLGNRTGFARNLKIHVKEGFLSASTAEKIDDQTWKMQHIKYTSCDQAPPHWAFTAHKAILYKNSVLKASGLLFKIRGIPIFAFPGLVFPLQNRAGSGFLIPRLSYDAELGFGFKQEYYWLLGSHCDTTIGFHLVEKKGFILSDEFRWARSSENFLLIESHYAEEWDALLERRGRIISATDKHYWIQGKYFQPIFSNLLQKKTIKSKEDIPLRSLIRFDFGTDKRIGYHFLNDAEKVEDSFCNSGIVRYRDTKNIFELLVHSERSSRKQFKTQDSEEGDESGTVLFINNQNENTSSDRQLEREEKVTVNYLPRYEWNTGYFQLWKSRFLPSLFYRHDLLIDHAYLESREVERLYVGDYVEQVIQSSPKIDIETARFLYKGKFCSSLRFLDQSITGFVEPNLHLRSNVKRSSVGGSSRYKTFLRWGAEWALPERMLSNSDYSYAHYIQPLVRWSYLPKFSQDHWHYIDKYDRLYPENRIDFIVQNNWQLEHLDIDLHISQGFDFYDKADIFPLNRCYNQKHLSPFKVHAAVATQNANFANFDLQILQEYSWKTFSLMQSEVVASLSWKRYNFFLGYLYQKEALRLDRKLFSDIPMFAKVGCTVPLGKELLIHYHGNFYSKYPHVFPFFKSTKPLLHSLKLNYDGHCWGLAIGFEEKRYRQYGKWKSERAITLALRLESIGSFAQKFRKAPTYRAPKDYE